MHQFTGDNTPFNYRSTPTGYYALSDSFTDPVTGEVYSPDMNDPRYGENPVGMFMNPIPAYGVPAPKAEFLGLHSTFDAATRDPLYKEPSKKRAATYGCVNCEKPFLTRALQEPGVADTAMVIDSKNAEDRLLLDQLTGEAIQSKGKRLMSNAQTKRTQYKKGGWLNKYK